MDEVTLDRVLRSAIEGQPSLPLPETSGHAKLGGPATAVKLRQRLSNLHVLFTSGYSESSAAALSQISGSRYLQKPYSPMSLARVLREILAPSAVPELLNSASRVPG